MRNEVRSQAETLLAELGLTPKLTIYLGAAPGAGKTHRLLSDALGQARAGRRVGIGWIETKGRPQLDRLAAELPKIPPRRFALGATLIDDFDVDAALASPYETIVLDELAHGNPPGAQHAKRWQDALALRAAGKSVLGAFNVMHLDTVAPVAERIVGAPIREIVPIAFLRDADRVIALDVAPSILESRLRTGRAVREEDVERAAAGVFKPQNLQMMRELLLRVVDDLTVPVVAPSKTSIALAVLDGRVEAAAFVRRAAAFAEPLDLALEVAGPNGGEPLELDVDAGRIPMPPGLIRGDLSAVRGSLVIVPRGDLAQRILAEPVDRDVLIADPARTRLARVRVPFTPAVVRSRRTGEGRLTVFIGSVAGSGKTYAMLDRAQALAEEGVDVVAALIETHGRSETAAKLAGLELMPRTAEGELDVDSLVLRRPAVALIDELAHTNPPGSARAKRWEDVFVVLGAGIDVMTTLNVQHLDGVYDAVERLTGTCVRETLPDEVLEAADEIVFIDVTPDVLRERLREGKVYARERVDAALGKFFRTENLAALRELAVREVLRARSAARRAPPFERVVLGVAPRERDLGLIKRASRLAHRLEVGFRVVCVAPRDDAQIRAEVDTLARATESLGGAFIADVAADAAKRVAALVQDGDVLLVESPRGRKRLFGGRSFALRVLDAGVAELLVLAPREREAGQK